MRDVSELLAECKQLGDEVAALLAKEQLHDWLARLRCSRQELLRRLKVRGVAALSDRQAIVNALARAWRESRVPLASSLPSRSPPSEAASGLPSPSELWRLAMAEIGRLRLIAKEQLVASLPLGIAGDGVRDKGGDGSGQVPLHHPLSLLADAMLSDEDVALAWPTDFLSDVLEAVGWAREQVFLLKEGCGLNGPTGTSGKRTDNRPRLGQPIAFWTNQMCERGTEVALYDYADFAERCLGMTSWIVHPSHGFAGVVAKFKQRFGARVVETDWDDVGGVLSRNGIRHLYIIKEGTPFVPDVRALPPTVRALVHCVFHADTPHGDVYAKISPCVRGAAPVVPHIVRPRDTHGPDMRAELGIPKGATVFGRHGGKETFSIGFAREAVVEVAKRRRDIYFVFLNTYPLHEMLPNVIHLERTSDAAEVSRFIRTCDAMLHARDGGETFGLACAEFSAHHRPVLTSAEHDDRGEGRMHLDVLGSRPPLRAFFYRSHAELTRLLLTFDRTQHAPCEAFNAYAAFEPAKVMAIFERVFLGGPAAPRPVAPRAPLLDGCQVAHRNADPWISACGEGRLCMESCGTLALPGTNAVFLSMCRDSTQHGRLVQVFRNDALATYSDSSIHAAIATLKPENDAENRAASIDQGVHVTAALPASIRHALGNAASLAQGEDPRAFCYRGHVHIVDNTLDRCRLLMLDAQGRLSRTIGIVLSGKNLTFLPPSSDGSEGKSASDEGACGGDDLFLVHWFIPLRVYRVVLPPLEQVTGGATEPLYASLECVYAAPSNEWLAKGNNSSTIASSNPQQALGVDGNGVLRWFSEADDDGRPASAERPRADEFRGGTPGRPVGPGVWWGLLHRTYHGPGGVLKHDPWAWVLRQHHNDGGHGQDASFHVQLSRVVVEGRSPQSNVFDPCSIVDVGQELWVTTAESEKGWFEPQVFRTGVYRLRIRAH